MLHPSDVFGKVAWRLLKEIHSNEVSVLAHLVSDHVSLKAGCALLSAIIWCTGGLMRGQAARPDVVLAKAVAQQANSIDGAQGLA